MCRPLRGGFSFRPQAAEDSVRIAIVQLSDIHVREGRANPVLATAERIASALAPDIVDCEATFLVITGDVAYGGKVVEYEEFSSFLGELQRLLADRSCPVRSLAAVVLSQ